MQSQKISGEKDTSNSAFDVMVHHEGFIDYPNRVNRGLSPGFAPAEVV